jgi:hypothetical protein
MAQWEYRTIDLGDVRRKTDDLLNGAGELGWELVGITIRGIAYLKREVATPSPSRRNKPRVTSSSTRQGAPLAGIMPTVSRGG